MIFERFPTKQRSNGFVIVLREGIVVKQNQKGNE